MKREKSCGCVVFNKDKNVLLVKMNLGHWSFPKGHVEGNETEHETAYREVDEETGIKCKIINGFREISTYKLKDNVLKEVVYFVAKSSTCDIKLQLDEISNGDFYSIDVARKLITFDNDLEILEKAVRFHDDTV